MGALGREAHGEIMYLSWLSFGKSPRIWNSGNPQAIHQQLEDFIQRANLPLVLDRDWKHRLLCAKGYRLFCFLLKTNTSRNFPWARGPGAHTTAWLESLLWTFPAQEEVSVSHSVWSTAGTARACGGVTVQACAVVSASGWAPAEGSRRRDWGCRRRNRARGQVLFH